MVSAILVNTEEKMKGTHLISGLLGLGWFIGSSLDAPWMHSPETEPMSVARSRIHVVALLRAGPKLQRRPNLGLMQHGVFSLRVLSASNPLAKPAGGMNQTGQDTRVATDIPRGS